MNAVAWFILAALVVVGVVLVRMSRTLDDIKHQVYRNGGAQEGDGE